MGLSVAQVRLLALTNRKSDIELQVQLNSKRKQMLTRKSTELAQQYYNRLQNSTIQYATTNGYEDVNYNYLMGETTSQSSCYTNDFIENVAEGTLSEYMTSKNNNNMILVNQYGEVIANSTVTNVVSSVKATYGSTTVFRQTAQSVLQLIKDTCMKSTAGGSQAIDSLQKVYAVYEKDNAKREELASYLEAMIENGGFIDGGNVFQNADNGKWYTTEKGAYEKDSSKEITLKDGVCYLPFKVTSTGSDTYKTEGLGLKCVWYANAFTDITKNMAQTLGNLAAYFAPIFSASLQNGTAEKATTQTASGGTLYVYDYSKSTPDMVAYNGTNCDVTYSGTNAPVTIGTIFNGITDATWTDGQIQAALNHGTISGTEDAFSMIVIDKVGKEHYFNIVKNKEGTGYRATAIDQNNVGNQFYKFKIDNTKRGNFSDAQYTDNLQAGLKSGMYQLCMVDDLKRGSYKKNTTLTYFVNMNYVLDRTDSSKKEEITAWFNTEQAKISEKETYWDTEIQNLSTELNSVNTEIESVKQLKSNAIKSVFSWGSS